MVVKKASKIEVAQEQEEENDETVIAPSKAVSKTTDYDSENVKQASMLKS